MSTTTAPAGATAGTVVASRGLWARLQLEVVPLYMRSIRNTLRVPVTFIPSLVMPVMFLIINTSQLGDNVSFAPPAGVDLPAGPAGGGIDYIAFFIPVSLAMTIASAGNSSGLALVQDIASGFFDKLMIAPISRTSILVSRLMVDGTRAMIQAAIIVAVGLVMGASVAGGFAAILLTLVMAFLFGTAFAGLSLSIALKTGSPEATQGSFMLFFPMVFLAPTFVPMEALPGWLQAIARVNPLTYVIEGLRSLFIVGIDWGEYFQGMLAVGVVGAVSLTMAFRALKVRATA